MTLKSICTFALTLSISTLSLANTESKPCRQAIVDAQASLGNTIAPDSFSSYTFESLNISPAQFNLLDSEEQVQIYNQVKPLEEMVDSTVKELTGQINRYLGTFYEFYMTDEIQSWRAHRDTLRACDSEE